MYDAKIGNKTIGKVTSINFFHEPVISEQLLQPLYRELPTEVTITVEGTVEIIQDLAGRLGHIEPLVEIVARNTRREPNWPVWPFVKWETSDVEWVTRLYGWKLVDTATKFENCCIVSTRREDIDPESMSVDFKTMSTKKDLM